MKKIIGVMLTLCMLLSVLPLTPVVSAATEIDNTQGVISVIHDEPFYSGFNEFNFTVNGRASKLRIVNADGETYTVSRHSTLSTGADVQGLVAIKSYDAEGNEVSNGSADIDYERWKINLNLAEGEYTAEAKYDNDWCEVAKNFTVNYNFGAEVVSVKINGTANGGFNKYAVEICGSASKVQVVFANGSTYTFDRISTMSSSDSSKGVASIKAYDKDDNEVALGSNSTASELWVINMSLKEGTYTVKAKHKNTWETDGQTLTVAYPTEALDEVKVTKVEGENGSYCFNVNGTAQKLQLVYSDGQTTTLTKSISSVSVKYYNSENAEVDQNSGEIAYEIWTLNKKLKDGEYTAIAKYHNGTTYVWGTTALEFTVELGKLTSSIDGDKIKSLAAFTYEKNSDGKVKITGVKDTSVTELTVPDFVYEIAFGAFKDCTSLQKLTVPYVGNRSNGEYYIVGYIFGAKNFSQNETVMPTSLKEITVTGGYSNNETLRTKAFYNCLNVTNIVIGDGVTHFEQSVFYDCISLESITLPFIGSDKEGRSAYRYYSFGYVFGNSANFLGSMYRGTYYKASVQYSYWNAIDYDYFSAYFPNSLKTVTINGGDIFNDGFYSCSSIEKIVLGDGVKNIGYMAFMSCPDLNEVTIPTSVETIGYEAFWGTKYEEKLNNEMQDDDGFIYINDILYKYNGESNVVSIKEGTRAISAGAFYSNKYIETVKCPSSLRYIGSEFRPGNGAFQNCTNLKKVELNEGLEVIGYRSFYGCTSLDFTDFPSTVNFIGDFAFYNTAYLSNLSDGEHYIGKVFYKYSGEMPENTTITIKEGTVGIGFSALSDSIVSGSSPRGFENLVEVIMPDSVTWIGDTAFKCATNLKNIKLSKNLTQIGSEAFYNCSSLSDITIPKNVEAINFQTFYGCKLNLTFEENSSLKKIAYCGLGEMLTGSFVYIPESVDYIGEYGLSTNATVILPLINAEIDSRAFVYNVSGTIFFKGSKMDSYKLDNVGGNFYYYSEYEPDASPSEGYKDKYWHYDENGKPVSWNDEIISPPKFEVLSSTPGATDSEGAANLTDDRVSSKWCVSFDSENGAYVTFSIGQEAVLNGYSFTTANDNADYPGRNPKSWIIYGSNDENCADSSYEGWTEICSVTDDETMQDINYTEYSFSADGNTTAYQYYKIVFTANGGNDILQLSEITLSYTLS